MKEGEGRERVKEEEGVLRALFFFESRDSPSNSEREFVFIFFLLGFKK